MRNVSLIALTAILAIAGLGSAGIEVLGIEVLGPTERGIEVLCMPVEPGSYVEAYMIQDGIEVLSDVQPVDPATGRADVFMPEVTPGSFIDLKNPAGLLVDRIHLPGIEVLGIEVLGPTERGIEVLSMSFEPGSRVEAYMVQDGIEVLAAADEVDPGTGESYLFMPEITPGSFIDLKNAAGDTMARILLDS